MFKRFKYIIEQNLSGKPIDNSIVSETQLIEFNNIFKINNPYRIDTSIIHPHMSNNTHKNNSIRREKRSLKNI